MSNSFGDFIDSMEYGATRCRGGECCVQNALYNSSSHTAALATVGA